MGTRTLPSYVEVTIFRAVQELLSNSARLSHAQHAQVSVDLTSEPVLIEVRGDGPGFDPEQVLAHVRARGNSGLGTLQKRVELLGGRIAYDSSPGQGTHIRVEIPTT